MKIQPCLPEDAHFQGGLSLGTIDDLLISLEYIKRVYGREALPRVLVLGISPRFVANLPEQRPFLEGLERLQSIFRIEETPSGPRLKPKTHGRHGPAGYVSFYLSSRNVICAVIVAIARDFIT